MPIIIDTSSQLKLTEVHSTVRIALQPDLDPHLRIVNGFRDVEKRVDAGLGEDELLVVDSVVCAGSDAETCTNIRRIGR